MKQAMEEKAEVQQEVLRLLRVIDAKAEEIKSL
jgi:hypothetical protein